MNRDFQSNDEDLAAEVHGFLSIHCGIANRTSLQLAHHILKKRREYPNLESIIRRGNSIGFRRHVDRLLMTDLQESQQEIDAIWEQFRRGLNDCFEGFPSAQLERLKQEADDDLRQAFVEKKIGFLTTLCKNGCMLAAAYLSILLVEGRARSPRYFVPRALVWLRANPYNDHAQFCLERFAELGIDIAPVDVDPFNSPQSGMMSNFFADIFAYLF